MEKDQPQTAPTVAASAVGISGETATAASSGTRNTAPNSIKNYIGFEDVVVERARPTKKLTLVAQFDDLVRRTDWLVTEDEETRRLISLLRQQDDARRVWLRLETDHSCCAERAEALQQECRAMETRLKHARNQIALEMERRRSAERRRAAVERQVAEVRALLVVGGAEEDEEGTAETSRKVDRHSILKTLERTDFGTRSHFVAPPSLPTTTDSASRSGAELHTGQGGAPPVRTPRRHLHHKVSIDESCNSILDDDISYDKTEDDLETKAPAVIDDDDEEDDDKGGGFVTLRRSKPAGKGRKGERKSRERRGKRSSNETSLVKKILKRGQISVHEGEALVTQAALVKDAGSGFAAAFEISTVPASGLGAAASVGVSSDARPSALLGTNENGGVNGDTADGLHQQSPSTSSPSSGSTGLRQPPSPLYHRLVARSNAASVASATQAESPKKSSVSSKRAPKTEQRAPSARRPEATTEAAEATEVTSPYKQSVVADVHFQESPTISFRGAKVSPPRPPQPPPNYQPSSSAADNNHASIAPATALRSSGSAASKEEKAAPLETQSAPVAIGKGRKDGEYSDNHVYSRVKRKSKRSGNKSKSRVPLTTHGLGAAHSEPASKDLADARSRTTSDLNVGRSDLKHDDEFDSPEDAVSRGLYDGSCDVVIGTARGSVRGAGEVPPPEEPRRSLFEEEDGDEGSGSVDSFFGVASSSSCKVKTDRRVDAPSDKYTSRYVFNADDKFDACKNIAFVGRAIGPDKEETRPKLVYGDRGDDRMSKVTTTTSETTLLLSPVHRAGLRKPHTFEARVVVKMDSCIACGKRIAFGKMASKCVACRSMAHPECRPLVPLPCIPAPLTPKHLMKGTLEEFVPPYRPMIPAVVVHCVQEIESRGLNEQGLYRIPGSEAVVKELLEKFLRGRGSPKLCRYDDIHVIASCIKHFLRKLKEPLVTHALWGWFVQAAEEFKKGKTDDAYAILAKAVSNLPPANVDTLSFIILHLVRISQTPCCKMPVQNLAKVFGPTLIGYSSPEPEAIQMLHEPRKQIDVLELMMSGVPVEYWESVIGSSSGAASRRHDNKKWDQPGHPFLFGPR